MSIPFLSSKFFLSPCFLPVLGLSLIFWFFHSLVSRMYLFDPFFHDTSSTLIYIHHSSSRLSFSVLSSPSLSFSTCNSLLFSSAFFLFLLGAKSISCLFHTVSIAITYVQFLLCSVLSFLFLFFLLSPLVMKLIYEISCNTLSSLSLRIFMFLLPISLSWWTIFPFILSLCVVYQHDNHNSLLFLTCFSLLSSFLLILKRFSSFLLLPLHFLSCPKGMEGKSHSLLPVFLILSLSLFLFHWLILPLPSLLYLNKEESQMWNTILIVTGFKCNKRRTSNDWNVVWNPKEEYSQFFSISLSLSFILFRSHRLSCLPFLSLALSEHCSVLLYQWDKEESTFRSKDIR